MENYKSENTRIYDSVFFVKSLVTDWKKGKYNMNLMLLESWSDDNTRINV